MFIIKLLSQHVLGIIMPIIRRTIYVGNVRQVNNCDKILYCLHELSYIQLVRPTCTLTNFWMAFTVSHSAVQNTICGSTRSCSPDDGHSDARNMLRKKFDNKHRISCILLASLSSLYFHDARSQEPKIYCFNVCLKRLCF